MAGLTADDNWCPFAGQQTTTQSQSTPSRRKSMRFWTGKIVLVTMTAALAWSENETDVYCEKGSGDPRGKAALFGTFAVQETAGGKLTYTVSDLKQQFAIDNPALLAVEYRAPKGDPGLDNVSITIRSKQAILYRTRTFARCSD